MDVRLNQKQWEPVTNRKKPINRGLETVIKSLQIFKNYYK